MKNVIITLCFLFPFALTAQPIELRVQTGHTGFPKSMSLSQDGKWLASAGTDKLIKIWDMATGREIKSFVHETLIQLTVVSMGFNRKYMATASVYEVRLWDLENNMEVEDFSCPLSINQAVANKAIALSPVANILAVGNYEANGMIGLVEVPSGKLIKKLTGHVDHVLSLDFSPDGKNLVSGGLDKVVRVWDVAKGKEIHQMRKHQDAVYAVDYGSNNVIASCSMYNNITLWDAASGTEKISFKGADKDLTANHVQISPDGNFLLSCDDRNYRLWDISKGTELLSISTFIKEFPALSQQNHAIFSNDSKYFYTNLPLISTYNLKGKKIRDFKGLDVYNDELGFDEHGMYPVEAKFASASHALLRYWNINQITTKKINATAGGKIFFSPALKFIAVPSGFTGSAGKGDVLSAKSTKVEILNGRTGDKIAEVRGHSNTVKAIAFSSDNTWMATASADNTIRIWGTKDFKEQLKIDGMPVTYSSGFTKLVVSPDNARLYAIGYQGPVQVYEVSSGKLLTQINVSDQGTTHLAISDNNKYLAVGHGKTDLSRGNVKGQKIGSVKGKSIGMYQAISVYEAATGKEIKSVNTGSAFLQALEFKPGSSRLVTADFNGGLKEYDFPSGNLVKEYKGHRSHIKSIAFNKQGTQLVSGSMDGTARLWNTETGEEVASYITTDSLNFAAVTKDNFYYCSKDAIQKIHFVRGDNVFLFEQYDVNFNRPDLVLEKLNGSPELIMAYRNAYKKRISRMELTEADLKLDQPNPELTLSQLPQEVSTQKAKIIYTISATDPKNKLSTIQVLINDVPVFGTDGISVRALNQTSVQKEIEVELTYGQNLITTFVTNDKGLESGRQSFELFYEGEIAKPDLYFIAIGASEFEQGLKQPQLNLNYASKDATDVSAAFKTKADLFANIYNFSLTNQQVTLSNINGLRAVLIKTKPNDVVIVFFAGHGLLDKDLNYYLSTYNVNFNNPAENGLPYHELSGLLDNISARKKLIFIDACHSGEVDKESVLSVAAQTEKPKEGMVFRAVGNKAIQGKTGLENSLELMKHLFADLRKSSGTTIISAAGGTEVAIENDVWKNGAFTFCLLNGLKSSKADLNHDGSIMLSELKDYMYKAVPELTQGTQQPTYRSENIRGDFRIW